MRRISTIETGGNSVLQQQLTIGVDLGDRSSACCVLNDAGEIVLERKLATSPEAMKETLGKMARCRIAMETGTHSPWVSRLLTGLGHEVIVGHAQRVRPYRSDCYVCDRDDPPTSPVATRTMTSGSEPDLFPVWKPRLLKRNERPSFLFCKRMKERSFVLVRHRVVASDVHS